MKRRWLPLAAAALLTGCATLGGPELAVYGVSLAGAATPSARMLPLQVLVAPPRAADPLSGTRVAQRGADGEYTVLPAVRWRAPPGAMLQSLLVESLQSSGEVAGAASTSTALAGDILLEIELRHFEIALHPQPRAVAEAGITVLRSRDGRALGTLRLAAEAPLPRRDDAAAVQALGVAMNRLLEQAQPQLIALFEREAQR